MGGAEMGVYRRNGAWWIDGYQEGRRVRRKIGPDRHDADLALKDLQIQAARGKWLGRLDDEATGRERLADFFLDTYMPRKRGAPAYLKRLDGLFRKHLGPALGHLQLRQIRPADVESYAAARAAVAKPGTVNLELAALSAVLAAAVRWGRLDRNAAAGVRKLRVPETPVRALTEDQEARLWAVVRPGQPLHTFLAVALHTGLRLSEVLSLRWDQVDFDQREVHVAAIAAKSRRARAVPMNDFVVGVLLSAKASATADLVFPGRQGRTVEKKTPWRWLRSACREAGVPPCRVHDLRHTFGTRLAALGTDPKTIMELLGHTSVGMTMRYLHTSRERKAVAVAALAAPRLRVVTKEG